MSNRLRELPSISALLETPAAETLQDAHGHEKLLDALREAAAEYRRRILAEEPCPDDLAAAVLALAEELLVQQARSGLRPVINATGVIVHTNLGRSVLAERAADAVRDICLSYNNLEADLEAGQRSSRHVHIGSRLERMLGAEDGAVFNNNAAAIMLALAAIAAGREVIISRGELVEIGGAFRMPEVIEQSGCILREVGATNRTHLRDYERAINENTAAICIAHPSNYRIVGFTSSPSINELADLAHEHGLPLIEDLGSGAMLDFKALGVGDEPMAIDSIRAGADVVTFSGDKLIGGPQCGIAVGKAKYIELMKKHPLARAVRVGKMTIAALTATLDLIADPERAIREIPTLRAAAEPIEVVTQRAEAIASGIRDAVGARAQVTVHTDNSARVGGGSLPEQGLATAAVHVRPETGMAVGELAYRLRTGDTAVYPRIVEEAVVLDARTIFAHQVDDVVAAATAALG